MWDAETGSAVGKPLEGHISSVRSVAYSPDGRHIISGSEDNTVRMWDAETGSAVGKPLKMHTGWLQAVAYAPDGCHIASVSRDEIIQICTPTCNQVWSHFRALPDPEGWVRDPEGSLLYWVSHDHLIGLHPPALLTIRQTPHSPLDFTHFVSGTSWTHVFSTEHP